MNVFDIGVRIDGHDVGPWILEGGSINYGRSSVFEQPTAPTAVLTFFTSDGWPQNPSAWFDYGVGSWGDPSHFVVTHDTDDTYAGPRTAVYIGAPVWVSATTISHFLPDHDTQDTYHGAEFRRFTGKVQSVEYEWGRVSISCSADLESWARVGVMPGNFDILGAVDTVLVQSLADMAPAPTTLHIEGDAGPTMQGYVQADYPLCLLPTLQQVADDADGLLYVNQLGQVFYRSRSWSPPDAYVLPAGIVDRDSIGMTLELGAHENTVYVEYGDPDEFGVRATEKVTDATMVARYGTRTGYYTAALAYSADAHAHGYNIVQRLIPQWHMPDVDLIMAAASDADVYDVCALEQGHPVSVVSMPPGAPVPQYDATVLGWTEDLSSDDWVITLHLVPASDYTVGIVETNPWLYWPLQEGAGAVAGDQSANGRDGAVDFRQYPNDPITTTWVNDGTSEYGPTGLTMDATTSGEGVAYAGTCRADDSSGVTVTEFGVNHGLTQGANAGTTPYALWYNIVGDFANDGSEYHHTYWWILLRDATVSAPATASDLTDWLDGYDGENITTLADNLLTDIPGLKIGFGATLSGQVAPFTIDTDRSEFAAPDWQPYAIIGSWNNAANNMFYVRTGRTWAYVFDYDVPAYLPTTGDFSLMAVLKRPPQEDGYTNTLQQLIQFGTGCGTLEWVPSTKQLRFYLRQSSDYLTIGTTPDDDYVHIVVTFDSASKQGIAYVDGLQTGTHTFSALARSVGPVFAVRDSNQPDTVFSHVAFWDRTLTADEAYRLAKRTAI